MVCDVGRNSGRLVLSAGHFGVKKLICVNILLKKFGGNEKSSTFAPQSTREHSSVGLEHLPYKQRVRGSTPFAPTTKTTYRDVSRLFLCCFVWVFARSVGLAPRALAVAVCSDASIAQPSPSPSPAAFGRHSSPWQSHPLVFAKRCRTWIWGCGDRLILLLGLMPCAQRYPRQLALRLPL